MPQLSEHIVQMTVFVILFPLVSGMGFFAARWRQAESMHHLDEWGARRAELRPLDHLVPARR
jgi:hypothetical protein